MGLVMKNVMLVCNAGMSTGILAKKIEKASQGLLSVKAYGEAEYEEYANNYDLILLGPQIRHLKPEIESKVSIPVDYIAPLESYKRCVYVNYANYSHWRNIRSHLFSTNY